MTQQAGAHRVRNLRRFLSGVLLMTLLSLAPCRPALAQKLENLMVHFVRTVQTDARVEAIRGIIYYSPPSTLIHVTNPVNQWLRFEGKSLLIFYPDESRAFAIQTQAPHTLPFFQEFVCALDEGFGLAEAGFTLERTEVHGDTLVTEWAPPAPARRNLGPVLVGMTDDRIAFLVVQDPKRRPIGQVTYRNHQSSAGILMPLRVSAVRREGTKMTLEEVVYSDLRTDVELPREVTDFSIPEATTIEEVQW